MTEKMDFSISPEYCVPAMRTTRSLKLMMTARSEWVWCTAGSSLRPRARHDHEVRAAVVGKLLLGGAHEHLVRKERLAGQLGQDQDLARVAPVGTRDAVDHEDATLGEVRDDLIVNELVVLLGEGHVHVAPGNLVMDVGGVHDEAVLWRAARVLARGDRKCARCW